MVSVSSVFSKFAVTKHIHFKNDETCSDNNFKKSSSDFVGIIIEVDGTGPELTDINIGPIFCDFSEMDTIIPFSKFNIFTKNVRLSHTIVFVLAPKSTMRLF